jgi:hypothetical protein
MRALVAAKIGVTTARGACAVPLIRTDVQSAEMAAAITVTAATTARESRRWNSS